MKPGLFSLIGFVSGAVLGFAWSQGTKSALPGRVKTDVSGGIIRVEVDAKGAATDGLLSLFSR